MGQVYSHIWSLCRALVTMVRQFRQVCNPPFPFTYTAWMHTQYIYSLVCWQNFRLSPGIYPSNLCLSFLKAHMTVPNKPYLTSLDKVGLLGDFSLSWNTHSLRDCFVLPFLILLVAFVFFFYFTWGSCTIQCS